MYNNPYVNTSYVNPIVNPQQRMEQLVGQYPQYFNQNVQTAMVTQPGLKITMVSNIDEAKATPADLSGIATFFYNKSAGEIYMKQLDTNTGSAPLITFNVQTTQEVKEEVQQPDLFSEKFKELNDKIDNIHKLLTPQQMKVTKNDK